MRPNSLTDFILSPASNILRDVVSASVGIGNGIETFPLNDYVVQSVFLKMTGFQEQKMKAICWEMATNDYEYRYDFSKNSLGECSSYKDKQIIYKELIKQIKKRNQSYTITTGIDKPEILSESVGEVNTIFSGSGLVIWAQSSYDDFTRLWSDITTAFFAGDENNLFTAVNGSYTLKDIYENHLYRHRNRVAHNTISYQQNLPTLKVLLDENQKYENYFLYFSVLILIDKIFIQLFKSYLSALEDSIQ